GSGLPVRIDRVDSAGTVTALVSTPVVERVADPLIGHWSWVLPSPDGRRALAQWSGECETSTAFVVDVESGALSTVTGETGAAWSDAPSTAALGWAPDGRAIVSFVETECGLAAPDPGAYLVDLASGERELIVTAGSTDVVQLWTRQY